MNQLQTHLPVFAEGSPATSVVMKAQDNLAFMGALPKESLYGGWVVGDCRPQAWAHTGYGCDIVEDYVHIAWERVRALQAGTLRTRPMGKPVYDPSKRNGGH